MGCDGRAAREPGVPRLLTSLVKDRNKCTPLKDSEMFYFRSRPPRSVNFRCLETTCPRASYSYEPSTCSCAGLKLALSFDSAKSAITPQFGGMFDAWNSTIPGPVSEVSRPGTTKCMASLEVPLTSQSPLALSPTSKIVVSLLPIRVADTAGPEAIE